MRILYSIFSFILLSSLFFSCSAENDSNLVFTEKSSSDLTNKNAWYLDSVTIQGRAQGTTYIIKTSDDSLFTSPNELNDFFNAFDQELSTYVDSSIISQFNKGDIVKVPLNNTTYFYTSLSVSKSVSEYTNGAFDPTVFPLVKLWGFFKDPNQTPSKADLDSVLSFTGFIDTSLISFDEMYLRKYDPRVKLDFNAIAQGQSVDEVARMLEQRGQQNYFIEVGGEIRVKGLNDRGEPWVIGVDQPSPENDGISGERKLENYLSLSNKALATSGSYRKFYVKDGQKFSHTIDPKTGYPVQYNLLSVTVIGNDAATCDAYATAFMTMGVDHTLDFVNENKVLDLDVYLLFENASGRIERAYSEGMKNYFLE